MRDIDLERIIAHGLDPKDFEPPKADEPTQLDIIEAQVLYTALMTDTLLEEE